MAKNWQPILSHVKAVLMSRGRGSDEADDLVQEAFVRLACYAQDHTVREPEAFLMRAAQNLSLDAYRARKRHGEAVLVEDQILVDPGPALEEILLRREQIDLLIKSLASMNPRTSRIILAHRIDGASYAEIAREYGISVSAVEKQIAKAVILLGQAAQGWWP